jgi:hypothetical protein
MISILVSFHLLVLFSLMLCLVQEVVLKDTPNEVKNQEGGCAC